jgi:hypothetical protein
MTPPVGRHYDAPPLVNPEAPPVGASNLDVGGPSIVPLAMVGAGGTIRDINRFMAAHRRLGGQPVKDIFWPKVKVPSQVVSGLKTGARIAGPIAIGIGSGMGLTESAKVAASQFDDVEFNKLNFMEQVEHVINTTWDQLVAFVKGFVGVKTAVRTPGEEAPDTEGGGISVSPTVGPGLGPTKLISTLLNAGININEAAKIVSHLGLLDIPLPPLNEIISNPGVIAKRFNEALVKKWGFSGIGAVLGFKTQNEIADAISGMSAVELIDLNNALADKGIASSSLTQPGGGSGKSGGASSTTSTSSRGGGSSTPGTDDGSRSGGRGGIDVDTDLPDGGGGGGANPAQGVADKLECLLIIKDHVEKHGMDGRPKDMPPKCDILWTDVKRAATVVDKTEEVESKDDERSEDTPGTNPG